MKGTKNRKKDPRQKKIQKVPGDERIDDKCKKRLAFEKNQEAEAEIACAEDLNNFKNMLLDNFQPKDGKIKSNEWKKRLR